MSRILVVDDEPAIRTFLMEGLTDAGYTVLTASNGAEALQRAGECRSDAVLLDLLMPVMDGLTFLRMRQSQPDLARVPVVVLTAAGMEMLRAATKLRASAVLSKPLDLDVLSTVLEHVLRQPPRPVGTCPICGGVGSVDLDPEVPVSGQLDALRAARLKHVLLHSAEDFGRMPMRQQLLQLAADRRQLLTDWLYRDLRYDWGDQDRRGVHSVDEALSSAAVHRFWQDALTCSFEHCRHEF
ncbi:MAG: response regulator [Chloroflexi bacterium]|nr:MAG: response regulator [Chloroflexota bacterium]TME93477.1 MAG: response regulator [Chloroflexota bacterium]